MKKFRVFYRSVRGGKISSKIVTARSTAEAEKAMREALRFRPDAQIIETVAA